MAIEHDYSKRASWTVLSRLMRPHRRLAAAALALLLADIVGMLLIPTQLAALVNVAVGTRDTVELTSHGIAMLVAAVMGSGGCVASYYVASRLAAYVGRDLRVAVYRKSLALSGADFNSFGTGSMITRTLSDANVVQQTLLMTFMHNTLQNLTAAIPAHHCHPPADTNFSRWRPGCPGRPEATHVLSPLHVPPVGTALSQWHRDQRHGDRRALHQWLDL